jgi:hypothetical protein
MDNNGQPFFKETRYAEVNLIHIPFVSIREQLSPDLLKEPKDPAHPDAVSDQGRSTSSCHQSDFKEDYF